MKHGKQTEGQEALDKGAAELDDRQPGKVDELHVRVSDDEKYLIGKSGTPITREVACQMMKEYIRLIEEKGIKRVLSDVRGTPNVMNVIQDYDYAYKDAEQLNFPQAVRAAILTNVGDTSHDFAETVAQNAGYRVKVFDAVESALAWLMAEESP